MAVKYAYLDSCNRQVDKLGGAVLHLAIDFYRFLAFIWSLTMALLFLRWVRRPAVMFVLVRQIYFTGVQGLVWVMPISIGAGVLIVYNIVLFAKNMGDLTIIRSLTEYVVLLELGPLLISLLILVRSGVAVASEIGHMHIRREHVLLKSLGINPAEYLFLPRVLAFGLSGIIHAFIFVNLSIWLAGLLLLWTHAIDFSKYLFEIREAIGFSTLLIMAVKSLVYPMLCCIALLFHSSQVGHNPHMVPVRTAHGVMGALTSIVIAEILISIVRHLL